MITMPATQLRLIGVLRSLQTVEQVKAYCAASSDIDADIRLIDVAVGDAPAIINGGADIVVIEAGAAARSDIEALEKLCAHVVRGGSFIVIMDEPSADIVRRLFRAGVTDVLPTPVMDNELIAALDTARGRSADRRPVETRPGGKIVSVVKTAGGVGATTAAINIAAALQGFENDVGLVDLDIQFGDVSTALDITPRMSLIDVIRAGSRLDSTLLASTMHKHRSGLHVLAAPSILTPLDALSENFIERLFNCLRARHSVSFIDLPSAWTQEVGVALEKSDLIIVVVEPSVRSAAGAARIAQALIDFGLTQPNIYVLANKVEKTLENNARIRKISEIFHSRPLGSVRLDVKAGADASDRGVLFKDSAPKSKATSDFEENARHVAAVLGVDTPERRPPAAPLDRLFGARLGRKGAQA